MQRRRKTLQRRRQTAAAHAGKDDGRVHGSETIAQLTNSLIEGLPAINCSLNCRRFAPMARQLVTELTHPSGSGTPARTSAAISSFSATTDRGHRRGRCHVGLAKRTPEPGRHRPFYRYARADDSALPSSFIVAELSGSILLGPPSFSRKPQAHEAKKLAAETHLRLANLTVPHAKLDEDAALSP